MTEEYHPISSLTSRDFTKFPCVITIV